MSFFRYESSLRAVIQERALDVQGDLEDPFSSREILTILGDVARGLMYLHDHHVIHRFFFFLSFFSISFCFLTFFFFLYQGFKKRQYFCLLYSATKHLKSSNRGF